MNIYVNDKLKNNEGTKKFFAEVELYKGQIYMLTDFTKFS